MAKRPPPKSAAAQARARAKVQKGTRAAPPQHSGMGVNKGILLMLLAALVPFSLPTVVVVAFTMLPTLAAYWSERGPHRYAWLCVGGLNFAGVIPYLFGLWFGVHTLDEALRLVSDASMLLWAYGTASIGWTMYKAMPPIVASWLNFTSERRIASLKAAQRKLIEDWGDDVGRKGQPEAAAAAAQSAGPVAPRGMGRD